MEGTIDIRQAAMLLLDKIDKKIASLESILNRDRSEDGEKIKTEDWIINSWAMELELYKDARDTLEKQIIENEFDF